MAELLTPGEYQLIAQATDNLTANKIQKAITDSTATGTVTSIATAGMLSGGPITTTGTITTSVATNKLIGRSAAGTGVFEAITLGTGLSFTGSTLNVTGVGDVVGGSSSTDGEIARYSLTSGKIIQASATPVIVSVLGDITTPVNRTVFSSTFRANAGTNTSLLADSNGKVIINDNANLAATAIAVDFTNNGGYVAFKPGAVGGVSFGQAANMGIYFPSGTQGGFSSGGALVGGWDANGLFTSQVTEQILNGGLIIGVQANSTGTIFIDDDATGQGGIAIRGHGGIDIRNQGVVGSDITFTAGGAGSTITAISDNGSIELTPDTGWTASVGTASKAGIDSNDVIYTVGALQNLARTVVAIQNTLMTKGYFTV